MSAARNPYEDATNTESLRRPRAAGAARRVRTDPVRVTLDLPPEQHRALKRWCASAAVQADVDQVPMVAVLRLAVELLTEGEPPEEVLKDSEIRPRLEMALIRGIQRLNDAEGSSVRH